LQKEDEIITTVHFAGELCLVGTDAENVYVVRRDAEVQYLRRSTIAANLVKSGLQILGLDWSGGVVPGSIIRLAPIANGMLVSVAQDSVTVWAQWQSRRNEKVINEFKLSDADHGLIWRDLARGGAAGTWGDLTRLDVLDAMVTLVPPVRDQPSQYAILTVLTASDDSDLWLHAIKLSLIPGVEDVRKAKVVHRSRFRYADVAIDPSNEKVRPRLHQVEGSSRAFVTFAAARRQSDLGDGSPSAAGSSSGSAMTSVRRLGVAHVDISHMLPSPHEPDQRDAVNLEYDWTSFDVDSIHSIAVTSIADGVCVLAMGKKPRANSRLVFRRLA